MCSGIAACQDGGTADAPPPSAVPPLPVAQLAVVFSFVMQGALEDFTPTRLGSLAMRLASLLSVARADIFLRTSAGSALLSVTVAVASETDGQRVRELASTLLANPAAASAALGDTVLSQASAPASAVVDLNAASNALAAGEQGGGGAAAVVVVLVLLGMAALAWAKRRQVRAALAGGARKSENFTELEGSSGSMLESKPALERKSIRKEYAPELREERV